MFLAKNQQVFGKFYNQTKNIDQYNLKYLVSYMDVLPEQLPKEWFCPITQQLMTDPVIAADGFTYQKVALTQWFAKSNLSPITGLHLANINMIPNHALRHTIEQFTEKYKKDKQLASIPKFEHKKDKNHPKLQRPDIDLTIDSAIDGQDLYVKCQLIPPKHPKNQRNPCSIICILDVSESMDTDSVMGGKDVESHGFSRLDLVKHSINTMVEFMEDSDQIALVPFSTSAKIALPLTRTTKAGKNLIKNTAKNLQTVGTTNIWDGFKVSIQILKQLNKRQKHHNIFVVLLTDGQPNLNPPRGIVPTLIKFLDLQMLPRPNIHVFGYGYELDTNLLTQISEVGHGTYTYIPDCSMVGTAFVNFMAVALATITNNVTVKIDDVNPKSEYKQLIGHKKVQKGFYNIGLIQYGQNRQIVFKLPQRILNNKEEINKIANIQITYGDEGKVIKKQIPLSGHSTHEDQMRRTILRSKYLNLLVKLMKQKKANIHQCFKQIDEFYAFVQHIDAKESTQLTQQLLKELKNPTSENEGQVSKAFEKQEWFQKWGKHYIPSLFRAHLLQTCTNFKDPALQLYGGQVFEENRTKMDTIFIKMPPPQPTAKKVQKFVYKPAPVDMSDYYNNYGGCIHEECLVQMQDGTKRKMKYLKKGDAVVGGIIKCIVKTHVFNWIQMIKIGDLIITPWHPIRMNGGWVFPAECPGAEQQKMFIESYYNFVLQNSGSSLICEGVQCIGLGHNINDNPVTAHEYFSNRIIQDLQRSSGWNQGQIVVKSLIRNPDSKQVIGIEIQI